MIGFSSGTQDISIGVYNINTINPDKLEEIIKFMKKNHINILILIDTCVDRDAANLLPVQTRDLLRQGYYVASHPVYPKVAQNNQRMKVVGGQMTLAQPICGGATIKSSADRTGLVILTATTIRAANTELLLPDTYWPIPHKPDEHSQLLTANLHQFIKTKGKNHKGNPLDWIKGIIEVEQ